MAIPIHGAGAQLWLSSGSGEAVFVGELQEYSIELDADIQDVSALGSTWGSSVKGMNKWSGSASGNFDTASKVLWSASISVNAQKFYLYPIFTSPTIYYHGTCFVKLDRALAGGISAKSSVGFSWSGQGALSVNP
jgi:hypothetical protein